MRKRTVARVGMAEFLSSSRPPRRVLKDHAEYADVVIWLLKLSPSELNAHLAITRPFPQYEIYRERIYLNHQFCRTRHNFECKILRRTWSWCSWC